MKKNNRMPGVRLLSYFVVAFAVSAGLTLLLNIMFLGILLYWFYQYNMIYINGEAIMEEVTMTDRGYELSEIMQEQLTENGQWAMLLDEDGEVIWSYEKPEEVKNSFSRADIARMSRWYLEGYPVRLRVWDDEDWIMVTGMPRDTIWKYTVEFPIQWMEFGVRVGYWMLLFNFLWILALAVYFTRRWSRSREEVRLEWISAISHDIRTPLSMVMGYSDALEGSENLSDQERHQMAVIRHQSVMMKELVEDLNLTSMLEYSMQAIRVEKIRLAAVLREVAAAVLSDAKEGKLEMEVEISREAEMLWIEADRKMLARALRNLFHNSLQHSEQNETTVICLRMWRDKRWCCLSFADNGVGYPMEMLRQLRSRKKERETKNIRGLGIVRKVVLAHGGKIRFENNEEGGCFCEMRFRIVADKDPHIE